MAQPQFCTGAQGLAQPQFCTGAQAVSAAPQPHCCLAIHPVTVPRPQGEGMVQADGTGTAFGVATTSGGVQHLSKLGLKA